MKIHKEGYRILMKMLALTLAAVWGAFEFMGHNPNTAYTIAAISIVLFVLLALTYRSPSRKWVHGEKLIVSPADGKIQKIEEVDETEFFNQKRLLISIAMSPIGVNIVRVPVSGKVKAFEHKQGKHLVSSSTKAAEVNERIDIVVKPKKGQDILVRQIAGILGSIPVSAIKEGNELAQNDEIGFIKYGARVDLYIPIEAKINVQKGDSVKAGITSLAEFS